MKRLVRTAALLAALFVIALFKIVLCLCSPDVSLHLVLALCHAVTADLVPAPQAKPLIPLAVVGADTLFALVYFVQKVARAARRPHDEGADHPQAPRGARPLL
jgi:hypothetical protein